MAKKNEKKEPVYGPGQTFGRPAEYGTAEELAEAVTNYFEYCLEEGKPFQVTGLALFLGFAHRCSLDDQEARGGDFSYIIKRARSFVESSYEGRLMDTEGNSVTGAIFALKNMGWKDKTEVDSNHTLKNFSIKDAVKFADGSTQS